MTAKMIRYYEGIGLVARAGRTDAGYRQDTNRDVGTLQFIKRSRDLGFSIERIRTLLSLWQDRGRHSADVKRLAEGYIAELEDDIRKLQSIRDQLRHVAGTCHGDDRPDCPILDDLARPATS